MTLLLIFGVTLVLAVYLSCLASRSVLSTAVLFLFAGFLTGSGLLGWVALDPGSPIVKDLTEVALFAILFTDGTHIKVSSLRSDWRLPARALLVGLPLTLLITGWLAHILMGLSWMQAMLVGAVLSPTDPVLVSAIVGNKQVPWRVRHLLNVESGFNDGLALPVVVLLIAKLQHVSESVWTPAGEAVAGVAIGIAVPWIAIQIGRIPFFGVEPAYGRLLPLAIGAIVFSVSGIVNANIFLAAFAAGITTANVQPKLRDAFHQIGENLTELLKLAGLLLFGTLLSPALFRIMPWQGYLFALLALVLARPAALALALAGAHLSMPEWLTAAWFGPKGFSSVIYAILILEGEVHRDEQMFYLIALVITASIVAHSSTDVVVANWLGRVQPGPPGEVIERPGAF